MKYEKFSTDKLMFMQFQMNLRRIGYRYQGYENQQAGQYLNELLSDQPVNPVNRRAMLKGLGILGLCATAPAIIMNTAAKKSVLAVQSDTYTQQKETLDQLTDLAEPMSLAESKLAALESLHRQLFYRKVQCHYTVDEPEIYDCGTTEKPATCTRTVSNRYHPSKEVFIDYHMPGDLKSDPIGSAHGLYQKATQMIAALRRNGMRQIDLAEGAAGITYEEFERMNQSDFARRFTDLGFPEGEADSSMQMLIASAIALPGTALLVFWGPIVEGLKRLAERMQNRGYRSSIGSRSWDSRERQSRLNLVEQVKLTRRSLMTFLAGAVGGWWIFGGREKYAQRSADIMGDAEKSFRETISTASLMRSEQLFLRDFNAHPMTYVDTLSIYIDALEKLDEDALRQAVKQGIASMKDKRTDIISVPAGAYSISWDFDEAIKDDLIRQYLQTAGEVTEKLKQARTMLLHYFSQDADPREKVNLFQLLAASRDAALSEAERKTAGGHLADSLNGQIPAALHPVLKAHFLTVKIQETVERESSRHMQGLAWDIGKLYILAGSALAVSEALPNGLQQASDQLVHGVFDALDFFRMPLVQKMQLFRDNFGQDQVIRRFSRDGDICTAVEKQLGQLHGNLDEFLRLNAVHGRIFDGHEYRVDQARMNADDIVRIYVEKAYAIFAHRQSEFKNLRKFLAGRMGGKQSLVTFNEAELHEQVLKLIEQADATFIFDLIDAGLIDDREMDEDWLTADTHAEVQTYIRHYADKLAAEVAATTPMLVALNIIDNARNQWWDAGKRWIKVLSRDEIYNAFAQETMAEGEEKLDQLKATLREQKPNMDSDEIRDRIIYHRLQNDCESNQGFQVLQRQQVIPLAA